LKDCVIIGKPNVGKTLFLVNFAEYVGAAVLQFERSPSGSLYESTYSFERARAGLVGPNPHTTTAVAPALLRIRVGKGVREFHMTDTAGICEGIHGDPVVRSGMADSLRRLRGCDIVLHMVDASKATSPGAVEAVGDVDIRIAAFSASRAAYAILANKMDLPGADAGLLFIRRLFPRESVIPTSALSGRGFREVRAFIVKHLR
jgi:tRNA U34 5-carboxymethylaminomethyl modifying GTPase MnmE/TrmE